MFRSLVFSYVFLQVATLYAGLIKSLEQNKMALLQELQESTVHCVKENKFF